MYYCKGPVRGNNMCYVLASGSPRRKELLKKVIDDFEILPPQGDEITDSKDPDKIVMELSFKKASEIFHKILTEDVVVIGADTVVSYNKKVLGKPADKDDARYMIGQLQGNTHQVYTGVTLYYRKNGIEDHVTFCEETNVDVVSMTDEEIDAYIATNEPDDKAGAYGVQGLFARYISGIKGDYYNVVGLPVAKLYSEMKRKDLL